jgi:hypothetical protein
MIEVTARVATRAAPARHLLAILTAAIFLSAALLFVIEPMFTKMVLPRLGGSPAVWSVAMVFFQTMLLAGYAYAYLLNRFAARRGSILVHLAVMLAAALTLPPVIVSFMGQPPASGEAFWLIGLFAVSIGLPFFALAANAPLLQAWFAGTDHPSARDPYFLYAASNFGSFLALLAYPSVIEPLVTLGAQTRFWSLGFGALIVLIAAGGFALWRLPLAAPADALPARERASGGSGSDSLGVPAQADGKAEGAPSWRDGLRWCALAAVPAGLLLAVTAQISTDVAAVPLLWILPLALYLLTFVIVFQRRPLIPHELAVDLQPLCIIALVAVIVFDPIKNVIGQIALHCGVFFVNALVCHGQLARSRPPARYLTTFYLWLSAGGMIGGLATGLLAPYVFNWIAEYPILIALAALCRPGLALPQDRLGRLLPLSAVLVAAVSVLAFTAFAPNFDSATFDWLVGAFLIAAVLFWSAPLPFAATIAAVLWINHAYAEENGAISVRSFFGVHKVTESADGRFRVLSHGTTIHGAERIRDDNGNPISGPPQPLTYYYDGSGMAQVMDAVRARSDDNRIGYAVIGLGTGSLACRSIPGDRVTYYEIDTSIVYTARDSGLFHFLPRCRPNVPIVLGDARLTLADAPDGAYDVIFVDAFTSDAIPIHLITREAMAIYLRKLAPHGIVAVHVSNRYLELASVVTGIAAANGALARVNDGSDAEENENEYRYAGTVVAVARADEDFGQLAQSSYWPLQEPDPEQRVWTDDYSNVLGAVLRNLSD